MRYRPFTRSGLSASAITLVLDDGPMRAAERVKLLRAALESGVNSFELAGCGEVVEILADAVAAVGRRAVVLSLSVGRAAGGLPDFAPAALTAAVETALERTRAERFDVITLEKPDVGELSPEAIDALERVRTQGGARMIGLSGGGAATDAYMAARSFGVLATAFNLKSGWPERNRIKSAVARGMTIVGYDYELEPVRRAAEAPGRGLGRLFRRPAAPREHAYDFMQQTPGWTAAQIGLAYALTEPALASVRVRAGSAEEFQVLAEVADRELPAGVAAQIEMARFAEVA